MTACATRPSPTPHPDRVPPAGPAGGGGCYGCCTGGGGPPHGRVPVALPPPASGSRAARPRRRGPARRPSRSRPRTRSRPRRRGFKAESKSLASVRVVPTCDRVREAIARRLAGGARPEDLVLPGPGRQRHPARRPSPAVDQQPAAGSPRPRSGRPGPTWPTWTCAALTTCGMPRRRAWVLADATGRYWKRETKRRCQGVSTARGA
jgi:hypothetical protein